MTHRQRILIAFCVITSIILVAAFAFALRSEPSATMTFSGGEPVLTWINARPGELRQSNRSRPGKKERKYGA